MTAIKELPARVANEPIESTLDRELGELVGQYLDSKADRPQTMLRIRELGKKRAELLGSPRKKSKARLAKTISSRRAQRLKHDHS